MLCFVNLPSEQNFKIADVTYSRFDTIQSLELNGCGMGYTDEDLEIGKVIIKGPIATAFES